MAKLTKNVESIRYEHAPFYNLANVRKDLTSLIVRASSDEKKVEAIAETLSVMTAFLKVRAKHAAEVRAANIEAAAREEEARAKAAAEYRKADAVALLRDGEAAVERAKGLLKALKGKAE